MLRAVVSSVNYQAYIKHGRCRRNAVEHPPHSFKFDCKQISAWFRDKEVDILRNTTQDIHYWTAETNLLIKRGGIVGSNQGYFVFHTRIAGTSFQVPVTLTFHSHRSQSRQFTSHSAACSFLFLILLDISLSLRLSDSYAAPPPLFCSYSILVLDEEKQKARGLFRSACACSRLYACEPGTHPWEARSRSYPLLDGTESSGWKSSALNSAKFFQTISAA